MKIGIEIDWQRSRFAINRERLQLADELGYDMVWAAEANGSDAISPLGYTLGATKRIGVGTRIAQNTSRSAPALAMAFQTMRHMAPEREIICGLGSSAPAYSVGWHGVPWTAPYPRMRDYIAIMRKALTGEVVEHEGKTITIPYREPGKEPEFAAMKSLLEPLAPISIIFGGGTELMLTLAAEIADGLLPNGSWSPGMMKVYGPMIEKGFAKRKTPMTLANFPIWAHVDVLVTKDIKAAMAEFKEYTARYTGGYGGKGGLDTHMEWRGYGDAVVRIKELYAAGKIKEAEAAVPDEYIDECWLIGPMERIVERWRTLWINDGCNLVVRTDNWPSAKPAGNEVYGPLMKALRE
ncbi:MAG: LLM class flavin-dependent oxidoreductase [Spongiibacteraceae bacterium]